MNKLASLNLTAVARLRLGAYPPGGLGRDQRGERGTKASYLACLTSIVLLAGNAAWAAEPAPASGATVYPDTLAQEFIKPPASARAWVYWFWLNGNISKEGITADLEAMKRAGLGGALWMWGGGLGADTRKPVGFLSPEWWELMRHAIREADRLGLELNITSGSGWSHSGGPWVSATHGMRNLRLAGERHWNGPARKDMALDPAKVVRVLAYPADSANSESMFAADVKVTASSTQAGYGIQNALDKEPQTRWISHGTKAGEGPSATQPEWLLFEFPEPYTASALYLLPGPDCGPRQCQLQSSLDGKKYQTVASFELKEKTPTTLPLEATTSQRFRLLITAVYPFQGASWNAQIAEARLLQKGERPAEKARLKSGAAVDLTDKLDASGRLAWDVPRGAWSIYVISHAPTGDRPHPIRGEEGGWECDKLNPEAVEANWRGFVLRILNECGPEARRVVRYTHVDSYEFEPTTWTAGLLDTFKKRFGYDPSPYLPAVFGKVVDSPEISSRFQWDYRRLLADLFAEGIGGHFRGLAQREGVKLTTEPHLVGGVFDHVQYGGHVAHPVGNFLGERRTGWYGSYPRVGPEMHLAKGESSAAYIYGLEGVVWAEAFTGTDHAHAWHETLDYLRTWGDLWLSEGINRFCFHCWPHSPWVDRKPGNTLGPWGIHFDRNNTWFELSTGYLTYLARSQCLLQKGLPVMDVCVLTGDKRVDQFPPHPELRANGYDYHGMTAEALIKDLEYKDDCLVLPSGMRYRMMATYDRSLRPQTMRKMARLVAAGATVMGEKPDDAPGLVGFPRSLDEVRALADEMWGTDYEAGRLGHKYGKGKVYWAKGGKTDQSGRGGIGGPLLYLDCESELQVLKLAGILPDFSYANSGKEDCDHMLAYMHRQAENSDLYFISNQSNRRRQEECVFRTSGCQPELWDAVTGEMRDLAEYATTADGRTRVPLKFEPGQSFFVVFRDRNRKGASSARATNAGAAAGQSKEGRNFAELKLVQELEGPWQVQFDAKWSGITNPVTFATLEDWTRRSEDGIKHYSGTATYRKVFDLPSGFRTDHGNPSASGAPTSRVYVHLGCVKELAGVRLNGKDLGVVWCAPWQVGVPPGVMREHENQIEIAVANLWPNRLIKDAGLPEKERLTWTTWNPYKPTDRLLPSGLLGPVRIVAEE